MPVQFKSMSEYKSHFTPVYPKHSAASTAPLVDEMIIQDTPNSDKVCPEHKVFSECEPPLQRKKRAPAPVTSLSSDFYDTSKPAAEDYILLGNNEKFVDNIRYRNRSSNNCKNLGEFNFKRDVSPPKLQKTKSYKENLEPKTAPGPVVDTTAYRGAPVTPSTPMTPREPKDAQTALQLSQKQQRNAVTDKTATKGGDKNKTKENDDLRKNITRVLQKEKQAASRSQTKDTVKRPTNPRMKTYVKPWVMSQAARAPAPTETVKVKDKVKKQVENDPHPTKQKVKVASQVKVMDQEAPEEVSRKTVQHQGTKQAAQEDQSDYSLKYKAGVNRPKRQTPLRKSEYQREFEWKNAVKASPLIDAEQMVYQSRVNSAPSKPDVIPKLSEYRAQFLQYPFVPADYTAPPTPSDKGPQKSASKIKRSKSVGAIDVSKGEESQSVVPPDPKQIIGESMATKHGKYRARGKSEYARNFQAPWKYEYVNGAWKASPPHLEQEVGQEEAALPSDPMTSWFREVMELRQKAAEYRKRAQGTHFSREHLVQLMARQVELWDQLSEGSRTLSALSLEAHASHSQPGPMTADATEVGDEPDEESEVVSPGSSSIQQESQKVEKVQTAKTGTKKQNRIRELSKKLEYSSADNGSTISQSLRTQSSERDEPDVESEQLSPETSQPKRSAKGRKGGTKTKPKPKSSKLKKGKQKPAKDSQEVKSAWQEDTNDGAANPDQPAEDEGRIPTPTLKQRAVNQPVMRHHLDRTTPSVGGAILTSPTNQRKVYTAPPVFGSGYQSCDEDSDSDSMPFRGASPPSAGEETNRFAARQAETFPKRTFPLGKVGASPTFGRPSGDTHFLRDDSASSDRPLNTQFVDSPLKPNTGNFEPRRTFSDDDDVLSVSARSIASSCSLASEVLERAQKRHNDFWGRRMHQTR